MPSACAPTCFTATGTTRSFPALPERDRIWSTYFTTGPKGPAQQRYLRNPAQGADELDDPLDIVHGYLGMDRGAALWEGRRAVHHEGARGQPVPLKVQRKRIPARPGQVAHQ